MNSRASRDGLRPASVADGVNNTNVVDIARGNREADYQVDRIGTIAEAAQQIAHQDVENQQQQTAHPPEHIQVNEGV